MNILWHNHSTVSKIRKFNIDIIQLSNPVIIRFHQLTQKCPPVAPSHHLLLEGRIASWWEEGPVLLATCFHSSDFLVSWWCGWDCNNHHWTTSLWVKGGFSQRVLVQAFLFGVGKQTSVHRQTLFWRWPFSMAFQNFYQGRNVGVIHELKYKMN